ncbi:unnamed protein product [Larinioides sclopetarius]|uniref:Uncharacterized protein n=1 Tax=Larinioides sclopetarius TaxID=280406 RepID=A0AAV2BN53_9ARAC
MPILSYHARQNRPSSTPQISTPSFLPHHNPSLSISTENEINKPTSAEYYEHFTNVPEENCERCSSVNSNDSSTTIDINF